VREIQQVALCPSGPHEMLVNRSDHWSPLFIVNSPDDGSMKLALDSMSVEDAVLEV